jgi:polysaccharide export outer membrane protein
MTKPVTISVGLLLGTGLFLAGCEVYRSHPPDIASFTKPTEAEVTEDHYVMWPPDQITVYCTRVPEIHLQSQEIRPDGKISFEAIGEIYVAGKTPSEVAKLLVQKTESLYTLPGDKPIDVRISMNRSKYYYVLGQVRAGGPKPYTGRDTVMTALAAATPDATAWESRIQVIRPSRIPAVSPRIFEVNFDDMQIRGELAKDVLLNEGDILYVPPTPLAKFAMVLEEFLRPIARAFQTQYYMSGGASGVYGGGIGSL